MPLYKGEPPAVRVYTVCDESRYLIVRNVPELGCGDELLKLFSTYGQVEECKPMDGEECEPFTDVYWVKFYQINNARFAKRKLDESVFVGNRLQISYAPQYESLCETKEKLEGRKKEVLARLNPRRSKGSSDSNTKSFSISNPMPNDSFAQMPSSSERDSKELQDGVATHDISSTTLVSSEKVKEYFPLESMNRTVQVVREKLNKIQSSVGQGEAGSSKRTRIDNRRRI